MNLEKLLNSLPAYICQGGRHYFFLIARGTRGFNQWVVGYSDYEEELVGPFMGDNLYQLLEKLKMEIELHRYIEIFEEDKL